MWRGGTAEFGQDQVQQDGFKSALDRSSKALGRTRASCSFEAAPPDLRLGRSTPARWRRFFVPVDLPMVGGPSAGIYATMAISSSITPNVSTGGLTIRREATRQYRLLCLGGDKLLDIKGLQALTVEAGCRPVIRVGLAPGDRSLACINRSNSDTRSSPRVDRVDAAKAPGNI